MLSCSDSSEEEFFTINSATLVGSIYVEFEEFIFSSIEASNELNGHAADLSFKETELVPKSCSRIFTAEHKVPPVLKEMKSPQEVKKKMKTNRSSCDKQKHRNILSEETLIQVEGMLQKIVYMDLFRCYTDLSVQRRMKGHTSFLCESSRAENAGSSDFTVSKLKRNRKQAKPVHLNDDDYRKTVKENSKLLDAQGRRTAAKQQIAGKRSKTASKDDQVPSARKTVMEKNSKVEAQGRRTAEMRCHRLFEIARLQQIAVGKRSQTADDKGPSNRKTVKENSKFEAQGRQTAEKCCHRLFEIAMLQQIAGKGSQTTSKDDQVPSIRKTVKEKNSKLEAQGRRTHRLFEIARLQQAKGCRKGV